MPAWFRRLVVSVTPDLEESEPAPSAPPVDPPRLDEDGITTITLRPMTEEERRTAADWTQSRGWHRVVGRR